MIREISRRYEAYKDSGIEWLGVIPAHWNVTHIKRICTKVTDGAHTSPDISSTDYPFITVVNLKNGVLDFENCLYTSKHDYIKLVRNGCQPKLCDVLYSKDGTISESVVIKENRKFVVGSSFIILRPIQRKHNSNYIHYLIISVVMRFQASFYIKGASLPRISIFNVAKLFCLIPTILEQQAIADYLDIKTVQLDKRINLLTQKAAYYSKLKQALINETVTRGLDKSVAMKDSAVEWVGDIPEHWEVKRVKDIVKEMNGNGFPHNEQGHDQGEIPFYKVSDINGSDCFVYEAKNYVSLETVKKYKWNIIPENTIITAKIGEALKKNHRKIAKTKCLIDNNCLGLLPITANIKFSYYLLKLIDFDRFTNSGAVPSVSISSMKGFLKPSPPLPEQKAIADYLDKKTAKIDTIVETINSQIDQLKELRKTLINDVVTGQIKVV